MKFLTSTTERNIAPDNNDHFKDVIHVMPIQRLTVSVTDKYPINIDAPVVKWKNNYTADTPTDTNHALP